MTLLIFFSILLTLHLLHGGEEVLIAAFCHLRGFALLEILEVIIAEVAQMFLYGEGIRN